MASACMTTMRRPTATGTNAMVATQHPLAVDAALEMLDAGGSAADAWVDGVAAALRPP